MKKAFFIHPAKNARVGSGKCFFIDYATAMED